jgi:hypothetical protein
MNIYEHATTPKSATVIIHLIYYLSYMGPCHHSSECPWVAAGEKSLQIRRVAVHI